MIERVPSSQPPPNDASQPFREQWQVYQKVVDNNYLAHREVRGVLHRQLVEAVGRPFRFLDLACGDASMTVAALEGTPVRAYEGIDISAAALAMAKRTVASLSCPARLKENDFVAAMRERTEPADVVYVGLSLHHLPAPEAKRDFLRSVRTVMGEEGLLLIFEPTSLEHETRPAYLERYEPFLHTTWIALTPAEQNILWTHVRTSDYPESPSTWTELGHDAGFTRVELLFTDTANMHRVFAYRP
ncbi:MAG TPA: class I SAM-dependent methyltransferase [Planctomycetaceae bacterium]|jgi:ubiquinone/menaquinone biosynthesis C-methylase UbiE|nr:class I SAM-dependent methyltransferase [Planctomycetaceae bacterium]